MELIGFFLPRMILEKQIIKELNRVGSIEKQNKTKKSR